MNMPTLLKVDGLVGNPLGLTAAELSAIDESSQVPDVGAVVAGRRGRGVRLSALLALARPNAEADYLTLHSTTDDFHASVPLSAVREVAVLVYQLDGGPLPRSAGGPLRFLVPGSATCHTAEVDECSNVKFVDRLELSTGRGRDNRPATRQEHARLHADRGQSS